MSRGLTAAGLALAGAVVLLLAGGSRFGDLLVLGGLLVTLAAARAALAVHVDLPSASAPRRPVLFFNPKSGGGKAEQFKLADEARARGIEPIELGPPWDLERLVRDAIAGGSDGLAMAGGERRVDLAEVNGRVFVNNVFARSLCRSGPTRRLSRREAAHAARHRAGRARPRPRGP